MPPSTRLFTDRRRANSFGAAAQRYDQYRPGYPDALIDELLSPAVRRCLDVGAGTGIVSRQLADRGVDVVAVEPDERMADLARAKQIPAEIATFETWDPAGRRFDLVVFAASFHWVDPSVALPKVAGILNEGGRLALLWNRLQAVRPVQTDFDDIYRDYLDADAFARDRDTDSVLAAIDSAGFRAVVREYPRRLRLSRDQWLELLFTFSRFLALSPEAGAGLRRRLSERVGDDELIIEGDSLAILATPVT